MKNITPREVSERLQNGEQLQFLDVREPWEYDTARLENSILIPLGAIPSRYPELDPEKEWIVYCHHGIRSRQACSILESVGIKNVSNLHGGLDYWSQTVDRSIPQY